MPIKLHNIRKTFDAPANHSCIYMFVEFTEQIITCLEILTNVAQELPNTRICNTPSDKPSFTCIVQFWSVSFDFFLTAEMALMMI